MTLRASDPRDAASSEPPNRDEVDRIVAAWRLVAPGLDTEPLETFSRVTRLARHLDLARRAACRSHDLQPWEFDVISALYRAGKEGQLTAGQLVGQTLVSSGTMSNRIDRLVARGLAERLPAPDDGRVVLVRLTPAGRERAKAAMVSLLEREADLLAPLPDRERATLAALLRSLLTPLDT